jgi:hypothetical protein
MHMEVDLTLKVATQTTRQAITTAIEPPQPLNQQLHRVNSRAHQISSLQLATQGLEEELILLHPVGKRTTTVVDE